MDDIDNMVFKILVRATVLEISTLAMNARSVNDMKRKGRYQSSYLALKQWIS